WRIAKQLPGMSTVEQQAQRLRHAAAQELLRLLEVPQQFFGTASAEEQRVMMLVRGAESDAQPLRTAMTELLDRSSGSSSRRSREYLFGTIVSQLVPDEARILAALAGDRHYAVIEVVAKPVGRSASRPVLANLSTVGGAAGVALAANTPTYVGRLLGLGLVELAPESDDLEEQYGRLAGDPAVAAAKKRIEQARLGNARVVRRTLQLSELGRDFWAACAPGGAGDTEGTGARR
ncbi:MAG: DUF4393 domain-containing protein, partial [Actinobacteria bacterium]|nr:DUF4393 domain-containing protein [Actinomycetota bacterium]